MLPKRYRYNTENPHNVEKQEQNIQFCSLSYIQYTLKV